MKNFFLNILIFSFLIFSTNVYATALIKGKDVSGTIYNLYQQGINLTLPDGKWEVTRSQKDDNYQDIELYSDDYDTWAYIYAPLSPVSGDFWRGGGLSKCKGKDVFLSLVERSHPEATLCFEDQYIDGSKWGVATFNVRSARVPLKWMTMSFYIPADKLKTSISESQFNKIGKRVLSAIRNGFNGGDSSGMRAISDLVVTSFSESYADADGESDNNTYISSSSFENKNNDDTIIGISDFTKFCTILDFECDNSFEEDYKEYINAKDYKAWAVTQKGNTFNNPAWGYYVRADNLAEAKSEAIDACNEYKYASETCSIVLEGNRIVNDTLLAKFDERNLNIYANSDNLTVCLRATTSDGMNWEDINGKYGSAVQEAWNRNLDLKSCRAITKRFPKSQEKKPQEQEKVIVELNKDNKEPKIIIDNEINVESARYSITGSVEDESKVYVCVFENCQLAEDGNFKINRFNPGGEVLKITAQDEFGNFSSKSITVKVSKNNDQKKSYAQLNPEKIKNSKNSDRVALLIGIENYKFSSDASYANRDALFFSEYLQEMGIRQDKIKILKDTDAGLISIYAALEKWLPAQIRSGSTEVFLFFAGHGLASNNGQDLFLLAHDTDTDMLNRSSISRTEIFELINKHSPSHTFVFLDTCYSGASRQGDMLLASARGLVTVTDKQSSIPPNFTIFSAAQGNQIASGLDEVQHGLFSYFTMRGLEGDADSDGNKKISTLELARYVEEKVRENAVKMGREQIPMMHGDKDIIISNIK